MPSCCVFDSPRILHFPLLAVYLLSYRPVFPPGHQLLLPRCAGQIPCAHLLMRTLAPLPSTTLSQSKNDNKGKGKHKKVAADAHNLDSKPSIAEPKVEIDEFNMSYLHFDALQQQESERMRRSEWIKIGINTSAGKTAWPQSITYWRTIPDDSDLTFRTATGELVKRGKRMHVVGCDDWGSNLRVRSVQAPVCKHCCLLESARRRAVSLCCTVTKVICFTKVRLLRRTLMLGSRRC